MSKVGRQLYNLSLLTILMMSVSACSRTQIIYSQLDWIIPRYIDSYVSLSEHQYSILDGHTQQFLQWHCSNHLHQYSNWFSRLSSDLEKGHIDREKIEQLISDLEVFWEQLVDEYVPRLAAIMYHADDLQLQELLENISDKNTDLYEELVQPPRPEIEQELSERMQDRFERWFGSLTTVQIRAIQSWSKKIATQQRQRLVMRERWKNKLHQLFADRQDLSQFVRDVHQLIKHPQGVWTKEYTQQFSDTRQSLISLIDLSVNKLNKKQRQYFIHQTKTWSKNLNALSCDKKIRLTNNESI